MILLTSKSVDCKEQRRFSTQWSIPWFEGMMMRVLFMAFWEKVWMSSEVRPGRVFMLAFQELVRKRYRSAMVRALRRIEAVNFFFRMRVSML